ncbi:MAG: protein adenylyltransferase SelO [Lautropia sp.]|nr:protein adenylyltransferase SelO [Lautropia sp.]
MNPAPLHWNLAHTYRTLPPKLFSDGRVASFPNPQLLLFNQPLAGELGLLGDADADKRDITPTKAQAADSQDLTHHPAFAQEAAELFSGNRFPEGAQPLSQAYAGHQFGHFAMLGDGRATLIGEQITPAGHRVDIQLKGNGKTPYSRRGDGKAALGPMLREYLISEAMHALGIPTTRSLAVVTTGEEIYRSSPLTGAVLTRTAQSHLRVATFQFAAALREPNTLKALADYTIDRHYPEIRNPPPETANQSATAPVTAPNPYHQLLQKVVERQIALVARWQWVGFIHGVMNTDNMSISGETIDYGPCAFMDTYDPETVFSSIDHQGRYRYDNQPPIALWNLTRFAETLLPLFSSNEDEAIRLAHDALDNFGERFEATYLQGMAQKLGLFPLPADGSEQARSLNINDKASNEQANDEAAASAMKDGTGTKHDSTDKEISEADQLLVADLLQQMHAYSADYTNTFVRLTLDIMGRDGSHLEGTEELFDAKSFEAWQARWRARLDQQPQSRQEAAALMQSLNPVVIPRNALVEAALEEAESANLQPFNALLAVLQRPFDYDADVRAYQVVPQNTKGYQTYCGT